MTVHTDRGPRFVGPGPVDDTIAALITNPRVWESEPPVEVDVQPVVEVEKPQQRESKAVWLEYARSLGIEIPEGATKAEVIGMVG